MNQTFLSTIDLQSDDRAAQRRQLARARGTAEKPY
jgi:hypothetical protein